MLRGREKILLECMVEWGGGVFVSTNTHGKIAARQACKSGRCGGLQT